MLVVINAFVPCMVVIVSMVIAIITRRPSSYRRALEALTPEDVEPRKLLTGFIGLESPILYTVFA